MQLKQILSFISILLIAGLFLTSCEDFDYLRDGVYEARFCKHVDNSEFESTGSVVDDYLEEMGKTGEEGIENLAGWLEQKSCVAETEIVCVSCIDTNPLQSEIKVIFEQDNETTGLIMDIWMTDPLLFNRYHE